MVMRVTASIRRHPIVAGASLLVVVGVVAFVLLYFAPQQLFINTRLDEAVPTLRAPAASQQPTAAVAPTPVALLSGAFRSLEHTTTGRAVLLRLPDGSAVLRLTDFSTSNGPDVHVYLSRAPADASPDAFGRAPIELGGLRANQGNINYTVPAGSDLTGVRSAVIWCRRFSVGFGVAPLDP